MRNDHPEVRFEVTTDTAQHLSALLDAGSLDLCLTVLPEPLPPQVFAFPLCSLGMSWVAAPSLVLPSTKPAAY